MPVAFLSRPFKRALVSFAVCAPLAIGAILPGAAAAAPAPASTCGPKIAKPAGGTWTCTFADDFDGAALDASKWVPQVTADSGYTSGKTACFVKSPNNVAVGGGVLRLTARKEATAFTCNDPSGPFITRYTSGMVSTWGRFAQAYGRFEVRAKLPSAAIPGLQESLWLWPADASKYGSYPASGEIDIAEVFSQYSDRAIPYIHYNAADANANVTNNNCMIKDVGAFHTYAVEWTSTTIRVIYDGNTCLTHVWNPVTTLPRSAPFDQPFIVALTQALGIGTNAFDPATTPLPATTQIDYVRVWK